MFTKCKLQVVCTLLKAKLPVTLSDPNTHLPRFYAWVLLAMNSEQSIENKQVLEQACHLSRLLFLLSVGWYTYVCLVDRLWKNG